MNRSEPHKDVGKSRPQGNRIHADPLGASISTQIIRQNHGIRQRQVTGLSQANLNVTSISAFKRESWFPPPQSSVVSFSAKWLQHESTLENTTRSSYP